MPKPRADRQDGAADARIEELRRRLYQRDVSARDLDSYLTSAPPSVSVEAPLARPGGGGRKRRWIPAAITGATMLITGTIVFSCLTDHQSLRPPAVAVRPATPLPIERQAQLLEFLKHLPSSAGDAQRQVLSAVRAELEPPGATDAAIVGHVGAGPSTWALGAIGSAAIGRTLHIVVVASPNRYGLLLTGKDSAAARSRPILVAKGTSGAHPVVASFVDVGVGISTTDLRLAVDLPRHQPYLCYLIVTE